MQIRELLQKAAEYYHILTNPQDKDRGKEESRTAHLGVFSPILTPEPSTSVCLRRVFFKIAITLLPF